jgi:hypothetical protein
LGKANDRIITLNINLWTQSEKLNSDQMIKLEESFTIEKIKKAVFDSNGNKASDPDGLLFSFYQNHWEIVQNDISLLVNSFYNHTLNLSKRNYVSIVLIPKNFKMHRDRKI